MGKPDFIDFHCHPGLKTFLSANNEIERTNCWKNVNAKFLLGLIDKIFLGNMLDSNSSLTQLKDGRVSIAVVGLYAYEKAMITGKISRVFNTVINLLTISKYFKKRFNDKINYDLLERISSTESNYFDIFNELRIHLIKSKKHGPRYNLLKKISDYNPKMLNVILTIEGGHNLYNKIVPDNHPNNKVLKNLQKLKSGRNRYLFLALAHLEHIPMCTHAYGMKIIEDCRFKPTGYGISGLGKRVIYKALEKEGKHKRILIDIKHMSLRARLQYYKMLESDKLKDIPIIMSHAGVTGVSYNEMPIYEYEQEDNWIKVHYFQPDGLMGTKFNPWSINLYDEEIPIIIQSEGMIGINLDERILGTKQKRAKQRIEYFSKKEFINYKPQIQKDLNKQNILQKKQKKGVTVLIKSHNDLKHICNNILHIVKKGGPKAWEHICIGSDFDGLVNPVECYSNSKKFEKLHRNLVTWLPRMARSDPNTNYFINSINKRVDGIMFANAYEFLQKNFQ